MTQVLFVCMGNICRSPTAQGVFEHLVQDAGLAGEIIVDSAGTHAYHVGEPPDARAQHEARQRGIDLSLQRARQVDDGDFEMFDYIVAMDSANMAELRADCPAPHQHKLHMLLEFAEGVAGTDVPDPYFGARNGFGVVLDLVESASWGLLVHLRADAPD